MLAGILLIIRLCSAIRLMRQAELDIAQLNASENNICRLCNDTLLYDEQKGMLSRNDGNPNISMSHNQFYLYFKCPSEKCTAFYHAACFIRHFGKILHSGFSDDSSEYQEADFKCSLCQISTRLKPMETLAGFRQNFFINSSHINSFFIHWLFDNSARIKIEFIESLNLLRLPVEACKKLLETKIKVVNAEYFTLCIQLYVSSIDSTTGLATCLQDLMSFGKYGKLYSWVLRMDFLTEIRNKLVHTYCPEQLSTVLSSIFPDNIENLKALYEILYEVYFAMGPSKREFLDHFTTTVFKKECIALKHIDFSRVYRCKLPSGAEVTREFCRGFSERCASGQFLSLASSLPYSVAAVVRYLIRIDNTSDLFLSYWLKRCAKLKMDGYYEKNYQRKMEFPYQLYSSSIVHDNNGIKNDDINNDNNHINNDNINNINNGNINGNNDNSHNSLTFLLSQAVVSTHFWLIRGKVLEMNFKGYFNLCYSLSQTYRNCPLVDLLIATFHMPNKMHLLRIFIGMADKAKNWELLEYIFVNYKYDPSIFFSGNLSEECKAHLVGIFNKRKWECHLLTNNYCHFYLEKITLLPGYEQNYVGYLKELPGWFPQIPKTKITAMFNRAFSGRKIWNTGYLVLGLEKNDIPCDLSREDIERWCAATKIECFLFKLHKFLRMCSSNNFFATYFEYILGYLDKKLPNNQQLEAKLRLFYFLVKIALVHADGGVLNEMFSALLNASSPCYFTGILLFCLENKPGLKYRLLDWFAFRAASRKRKQGLANHTMVARALQEYRKGLEVVQFNCSSKMLAYTFTRSNFIAIYNEHTSAKIKSAFKSLISQGTDILWEIKNKNFTLYKSILDETVVLPPEIFYKLRKEDLK
ncbi:hypothetical protein ENBRE01_2021 [Enteropsectra breve]|nr:hypothetical protein ENBRE01_2021 [Enteropsectra breve]